MHNRRAFLPIEEHLHTRPPHGVGRLELREREVRFCKQQATHRRLTGCKLTLN
jgi:hypothetical protein